MHAVQQYTCGLSRQEAGREKLFSPSLPCWCDSQADGRLPAEARRHYKSVGDAISRIVREEGVLALWKGCGPTVYRAMAVTAGQVCVGLTPSGKLQSCSALQLCSTVQYRTGQDRTVQDSTGQHSAHCCADGTGWHQLHDMLNTPAQALRECSQCTPLLLPRVLLTQLATYDQAKEFIVQRHLAPDGTPAHVASSLTAAVVASVASNPFDVLKTRLMNMKPDPATGEMPYKGAIDCALKTVQAEGPLALYKVQ